MSLWDAPSKCKNASRYKGIREPKCLGGQGCTACWRKHLERRLEKLTLAVLTTEDLKALSEKITERLKQAGLAHIDEQRRMMTGFSSRGTSAMRREMAIMVSDPAVQWAVRKVYANIDAFDHDVRHGLRCRCRRCE